MALTQNIEIIRGDDYTILGKVLQQGTNVDDDLRVDITGWTLAFTMRTNPGAASVTLQKTSPTGGITITDADQGEYEIVIADTDTAGLKPGSYPFDVKRTDSGDVATLTRGNVDLQYGVTE